MFSLTKKQQDQLDRPQPANLTTFATMKLVLEPWALFLA